MTTASAEAAGAKPVPLWSLGFRPFFLAAGLWPALAVAVWIVMFATGETLPSRFAPLDWHIHAMLFGFVPAAIAGFLLTAIPNWTGRPPVHGRALAILAGLWLAGRVVAFLSALIPLWLAALIDLSFLFALAGVAAREIILARNWRNAAIPLPVCVLGIAN
ncbi:MAG: NnrS family protein, partial [Alphaproteobacteria bacterium]|nr:NnrS family protein [Alphaproteobacteria bacterium]